MPVPADVEDQLAQVLSSRQFRKARRDGALLRYLVAAANALDPQPISEYAIGIEVFGRDPATYWTGEDPIVRVQVGRLRHRLATYYDEDGRDDTLRFSIPPGKYLVHLQRRQVHVDQQRLAIVSASAAEGGPAGCFLAGLNDELRHRLHHLLGMRLFSEGPPACQAGQERAANVGHILESSVRTDGITVRTNLRLLDVDGARIVWSQQVDLGSDMSIARQEQLATLCCDAVREHFCVAELDAGQAGRDAAGTRACLV